jgi:hypothetical protein
LRWANSISSFLPATGLDVFWRCGMRTGHVASIFVQIPRDSVRAALGFGFADIAIQFAGAIDPCALGRDAASWGCVGAPELDQTETLEVVMPVDAPQQVIGRNVVVEAEIVKQLSRCRLNAHHRRLSRIT